MTADDQNNKGFSNNTLDPTRVDFSGHDSTQNIYAQVPNDISIRIMLQSGLLMGKSESIHPNFMQWVNPNNQVKATELHEQITRAWVAKLLKDKNGEKADVRREGLHQKNNRAPRFLVKGGRSELAYVHLGSLVFGAAAFASLFHMTPAQAADTGPYSTSPHLDTASFSSGGIKIPVTKTHGSDNAHGSFLQIPTVAVSHSSVGGGFISSAAGANPHESLQFNAIAIKPNIFYGAEAGGPAAGPLDPVLFATPPVVNGVNEIHATEDGAVVSIDGLANASNQTFNLPLTIVGVPTLPTGFSYDPITHTFSVDPSSAIFQNLAQGQVIQYIYNYGVSNGLFTTPNAVTFVITGINDAPAVIGSVLGHATEDGVSVILNPLSNASDVDAGSVLTVTDVPTLLPAGVSYNVLTHTFAFDPIHAAYQPLAENEQITVTVNYNVSDGIVTTPDSVSWIVTGTNDAPVVGGVVQATVFEDAPPSVLNALANVTDIDHNTTLTVTGLPTVLPDGVTFDTLTNNFILDPNNATFQHLGLGQSEVVTVTYNVNDGITVTSATAQWTINGVNDAPQITTTNTLNYTENDSATAITPNAIVSDVDSLNFKDGKLTVHFTSGGDLFDQLGIIDQGTGTDQIGVSGTLIKTISYEGHAIGTVSLLQNGLLGGDLVINFTTNDATSEAVQALLRNITYKSNSDDPSASSNIVSFTLMDGDGTANGGTDTSISSATINVEAVNDAPVNIKPGPQIVNEDTSLTICGLSVVDLDAQLSDIKVTLSVTHGTLNVDTGILGGSVVGNGTDIVTITGSQLAIDATLLQGVTYQAIANFNGNDQLTMVTDDLGNSGSGGPKTDIDIVNITVNPVNDAPVNTVPAAQSVNEDTGLAITGLQVNDIDSATLTVTLAVSHGTLQITNNILGGVPAININNNSTGTVTLTGTQSQINTTLSANNAVVYVGATNYNGSDNLTMITSDGSLNDVDTVGITINPVNDAPVVTPSAGNRTYIENDGNKTIDPNFTVTDVDSANLVSAIVSISSGFRSWEDGLFFSNQNSISGNYNASTGVLTLTGISSVANYKTALRSVAYFNNSENPLSNDRVISFRVDDGSAANHASNTTTKTMTVTPVNDPPVAVNDSFSVLSGNLVTNGSFETPAIADGFSIRSVVAGWTELSNQFELQRKDAFGPGSNGGQYIELDSAGAGPHGVLQSINTTPGATYTFEFDFSARPGTATAQNTMDVYWNGSVVQAVAQNGISNSQNVWVHYSLTVTATGTTTPIEFLYTGTLDTIGGYLDNVSVIPTTAAAITEDIIFTQGNVLVNDTDPDYDTLNVTSFSATSAMGATVSITNLGALIYNPTTASAIQALGAGQQAIDQFTYTISDGHGGTSTGTVSVTVNGVNDTAVIGDPLSNTVIEDFNVNAGQLTVADTLTISDEDQSEAVFQTTVSSAFGNLGSLTLAANGDYTYYVDNSQVQYLAALETKAEQFTVTSVDGTQKIISFNIVGVNDAAIIGDPSTATVTEDCVVDSNNKLNANGTLAISDADHDQSYFQTAVIDQVGNLGSLTLDQNGNYNYSVDNNAIQYLAESATHVDNFTVTSLDGTTKAINFTIVGKNDVAVIGDPSNNSVIENFQLDSSNNLNATETLSISDVDQGEAFFQTSVISAGGNLGALTLAADGNYTYSVANSAVKYLGQGQTFIDSFTVTSIDGTQKIISFNILGVNDAALIDNPTNSTVTEDLQVDGNGKLNAIGTIAVNDVDQGESFFQTSVISAGGNLGALILAADGNYTYSVANSAVQYLGQGQTYIDSFTVTSVDGTQKTIAFNIVGTNDAPVVTASIGTTAAIEQTPIIIDSGMNVTDLDSTNLVGATVSITGNFSGLQDVLSFTNQNGIMGNYNTTTGVLTLTGSATVAQYQLALDSVAYTNTSDTPNTSTRTISFAVDDGSTLNNASNVAVKSVSVTAVNDAPTVTGVGAVTYIENNSPILVHTSINVNDVDNTTLLSATVAITGNFVSAEDVLGFTNQNGITGNYNSSTGVLTLTGSSSLANYQIALRSVTYTDSSNNPSTASRTVTFTVNDGTLDSNGVNSTVSVTAVNDAPVVTASGGTTAASEQIAIAVDSGLTILDVDSVNLTSAKVSITGNFLSNQDVLSFPNQNGITGSYNTSTGVMTLTGSALVADYQTALRSITYTNTSNTPNTSNRTVSFSIDDGSVLNHASNTVTKLVSVATSNDAPVLATGSTLAYTENGAARAINTVITVSDIDNTTLTGATVSITGNFASGQDVLIFTNANGITGSYNAGTGVMTLSGSATLANYQTALRNVRYSNTSDNPSTGSRTVTYVANDGNASSAGVNSTVTVAAVNDAPVVTASVGITAVIEQLAVVVDGGITITDIDSTNLTGATASITVNFLSNQDALSFTNQNGITGSYNSSTGVLTLTGTASVADYQTALRSVTYTNPLDLLSVLNRTVRFNVDDGSLLNHASNNVTKVLSLLAVNDAPVVTASGSTTAASEQIARAVDNGLTVTDADSTNLTNATVSITGNFVSGQDILIFTNQNGITGSYNSSTGVLTLTGSATVTNYQTALRSVTYTNTSNTPDTSNRTVSFSADDGSLLNHASNTVTKLVTVAAVNDAPTLTGTSSLAYTENGAATAINTVIVANDVDNTTLASATVSITGNFSSAQDVLSFTDQNGITGSYNAGTGVMTLSGTTTLANYQTALRSVTYNNSSENPSILTRTITYVVNDGNVNSTGLASTVTVARVNDAPILTGTSSLAYTENGVATAINTVIIANDVDNTNLTGATVSITGNFASGQDVLSFTTANGITGSYNAGTGVMTLSGTTTLANYQTALRNVRYRNTSDNPSTEDRTVTYVVNDGSVNSTGVTSTVTVTAVNDAPILTGTSSLAYTENGAAAAINTVIVANDVDNTTLASATISITGNFASGQDVLSFTDQNGISGSYNAGTGVMTLSGSATLANYQTALRSVMYNNSSESPSALTRTITYVVNDGSVNSTGVTSTVTVAAVNDVPTLTGTSSLAYTENGSAVAINTVIVANDVDHVNLASARVSITGNFASGQDVLGFTNQNGISGSYNSSTGVLTLTGSSSLANYQTALRSVTYNNSSNNPSALTRTITYVINDGSANSTGVTSTVTVAAVNDAPVLAMGSTFGYTENGAAAAINTLITASDIDNTSFIGATVSITGNFVSGQDVLSFTTANGISGSYNAGTGVMTLSGTASVANYQTALRNVRYSNTSDNPTTGVRTVTYVVNDGSTNSNTVSSTVNVTAVNDAPTITGTGTTQTYVETANPIAIDTTLLVGDVDNETLSSATVRIIGTSFNASQDVLTFTPVAGIQGSYNSATGILTLSGSASLASYEAVLRSVAYYNTSVSPTTTNRTINFTVNDGALNSTTLARTVAVSAVATTPTLDLDADNSSGAIFANYYSNLFTPAGASSVAVKIADTDLSITGTTPPNMTGATVKINNLLDGIRESLNATTLVGGITQSYNPTTGILTLTGTTTAANYQTVLKSIVYNNTSAIPPSNSIITNDPNLIDVHPRFISVSVTNTAASTSNVATAIISFNMQAANLVTTFQASTIWGVTASEAAGSSVSTIGDMGSGFDSFSLYSSLTGRVDLVTGSSNALNIYYTNDVSSANGNGVAITGVASTTGYGPNTVSGIGDFNNDGYPDFAISQLSSSNKIYVGFGKVGLTDVSVTSLTGGTTGFSITSASLTDKLGFSVGRAGDINGDGIPDMIIGAPGNSKVAANAGAAYVILGQTTGNTDITLNNGATPVPTGRGFILTGAATANTEVGYSVAGIGDINHDGYDDFAVGAAKANATYIIWGSATLTSMTSIDLSTFPSSQGFKIAGIGTDWTGYSVAGLGDINGDGIADFAIGAPLGLSSGGIQTGDVYIFYGKTSTAAWSSVNSVAHANFYLSGDIANQGYGTSISSAGDFNADGFQDFVIGAPGAVIYNGTIINNSSNTVGQADLIYGGLTGATPSSSSSALLAADGFHIQGDTLHNTTGAGEFFGFSVSGGGDINGDGYNDILIGGPGFENVSHVVSDAGITATIYGHNHITQPTLEGNGTAGQTLTGSTTSNNYIVGGAGGNTINGGPKQDVLIGGTGNDTINANGGTSIMIGGAGNDTFNAGAGYIKAWGGAGHDTFKFDLTTSGGEVHGGAGGAWTDIVDLAGVGDPMSSLAAFNAGGVGSWLIEDIHNNPIVPSASDLTNHSHTFAPDQSGFILIHTSNGNETIQFDALEKVTWHNP